MSFYAWGGAGRSIGWRPPSGLWQICDGAIDAVQTSGNCVDRYLDLRPLTVAAPWAADAWGLRINNGASAGRFLRIGVYDADETGFPRALVHEVTLPATSTGVRIADAAEARFPFKPGRYWLGVHANFGGIQVRHWRNSSLTALGGHPDDRYFNVIRMPLGLGDNGWNAPLPPIAANVEYPQLSRVARFAFRPE